MKKRSDGGTYVSHNKRNKSCLIGNNLQSLKNCRWFTWWPFFLCLTFDFRSLSLARGHWPSSLLPRSTWWPPPSDRRPCSARPIAGSGLVTNSSLVLFVRVTVYLKVHVLIIASCSSKSILLLHFCNPFRTPSLCLHLLTQHILPKRSWKTHSMSTQLSRHNS